MKYTFLIVAMLLTASCQKSDTPVITKDLPNILWIVSEDNSPLLGCYGDTFATTPHIDAFATRGVLYTNAFSNAPVCASARCTLITGMYSCSLGTHNMRSRYPIPDMIKTYPEILRKAGYFCSNRSKTDFNFDTSKFTQTDPSNENTIKGDKAIWDQSGTKAHYKNRKSGQPFFSIFNLGTSHESSIHPQKRVKTLKHDPKEVTLPPYHPDIKEMREDWAMYYDKVEAMDKEVGLILNQLEKDGLAENTIVFYYSDHGGVLARSKRFLYDTGTLVPLIIHFPKKYEHLAPQKNGSKTDRLVCFADFAPTLLSLTGIKIPDNMQGKAFLGTQQQEPRQYVPLYRGRMDERFDLVRALRDKQFKYIRNYMTHRVDGQHLPYLWLAPSASAWEREFKAGRCNKKQSAFFLPRDAEELYDVTKDPWEVNNLATDPKYKKTLTRMRWDLKEWLLDIKDAGFLPEGQMINRTAGSNSYDMLRQQNFPLEKIISAAETASTAKTSDLSTFINFMNNKDPAIRYWGAIGCLNLKDKAKSAKYKLTQLLTDSSPDVCLAAAESLYHLGEKSKAVSVVADFVTNKNEMVGLHAFNLLDYFGEDAKEIVMKYKDHTFSMRYINNLKKYSVKNLSR